MNTKTDKQDRRGYNFKQNLLALSQSKDIDEALTEWRVINKNYEHLSEGKVVCICNKVIKRVHYVCNLRTNKFAYLGTACVGKFRNKLKHITNHSLRTVFMDMISDGLYDKIFDFDGYSDEVKTRLVAFFDTHNFENVDEKIQAIKELMDSYGCSFLNDLFDKCFCSWCKKPSMTLFGEHMCRVCNRFHSETKKQAEEPIEQAEDGLQLVENDMCRCGLLKENICSCDNPDYQLININKQLSCQKCDKWKCRCPNSLKEKTTSY